MTSAYPLFKQQVINISIGLPLGLCIPYMTFSLWMYAVDKANSGGGMFYFPTTLSEIVTFTLFLCSIAPAFTVFMGIEQAGEVLHHFGFPLMFGVLFSFPTKNDNVASIVGTLVMIICQSWVYGLFASLCIRILRTRFRGFQQTDVR